ncbi:MAG TPA: flagellin, partial [Angustibacter sp.]|nr:flagellin [Angustibacter sp.]
STAILQRMRDLAVQSANDTNDQTSRDAIDAEAKALNSELDRISSKTTFNNVNLLDGNFKGKQFQVGYAANDTIQVDITANAPKGAKSTWDNGSVSVGAGAATFTVGTVSASVTFAAADTDANSIASTLNGSTDFASKFTASVNTNGGLEVVAKDATQAGTIALGGAAAMTAADSTAAATTAAGGFSSTDLGVASIDLASQSGASSAIGAIDTAIKSVSSARGKLGALQNRFEHTVNNLNVAVENLSASESGIRDTDMAQEMTQFTRAQILQQAGTSMLAQANSSQQSVLKLLG